MRIHLGCGDKFWPGFVNCDKFNTLADVLCDVNKLEFKDGEAEEIHAIHLFEHLPRLTVEDTLKEWLRVLKPGGKLVMELPCLDKMAQMILDKEQNIRLTLLGLYGDPRDQRAGMEHKWGWTYHELEWQLKGVGFVDVTFPEPKFHIPKRDMRVEARKPQ